MYGSMEGGKNVKAHEETKRGRIRTRKSEKPK